MITSRLPSLLFLKPSGGVAAWNDARGVAVAFALQWGGMCAELVPTYICVLDVLHSRKKALLICCTQAKHLFIHRCICRSCHVLFMSCMLSCHGMLSCIHVMYCSFMHVDMCICRSVMYCARSCHVLCAHITHVPVMLHYCYV